jgi:hypothetical protein
MDGLQAWVALPREHEETEPAFFHHAVAELPSIDERGVKRRLIAGAAYGARSRVKTHSPLFCMHCTLEAGARFDLPSGVPERAAYVIEGEVEADAKPFAEGELLVFGGGETVLRARRVSRRRKPTGARAASSFPTWTIGSSFRCPHDVACLQRGGGRRPRPPVVVRLAAPQPQAADAEPAVPGVEGLTRWDSLGL